MNVQSTALVLAWVAITILAFAVAGIMQQIRLLQLRSVPAPLRRIGPAIDQPLTSINGLEVEDGLTVLLFASNDCSLCERIVPRFIEKSSDELRAAQCVIVMRDNGKPPHVDDGGPLVLTQQLEAFQINNIVVTPFAVGVMRTKVFAAERIGSIDALDRFVRACVDEERSHLDEIR